MPASIVQQQTVDVYCRPGCGFCSALRSRLAEAGVDAVWHDIWADPGDAAYVRSVADGDETVPTVRIGDQVLVNPRPTDVISLIASSHPNLAIDQRHWPPLRIAQWIVVAVLLVVSNMVARAGHELASWLIDGSAFLTWLGFGALRPRPRPPAVRSR